MPPGPLCALGPAVLMSLASAWAGEPSPPAPFPAEVEVIMVDAVVVDDDGWPVHGLTRDDFVLEEDGKVQEIVRFEAPAAKAPAITAAETASAKAEPKEPPPGRT